jgi:hypothetical protein
MSNPVTIGDKKYKYSPADSVTLETYAPIEPEYNDDDIRRLNGFKILVSDRIKQKEER